MALDNIDYIDTAGDSAVPSPAIPAVDPTAPTPLSAGAPITRKFDKDIHAQRNDTTRRVEAEVYRILSWENPIRSAVIFLILVGSIILTHSYSLLQIGAAGLTVAIGCNLVYVSGTKFSQTFIVDRQPMNPYDNILTNKDQNLLNKDNAIHYSSLGVDVAETIARALTRIVLIEDTMTSIKWLCIFFTTWQISAYVPSRVIILIFITSAFTIPRLYASNKDLIDARIQQGQAILNTQLQSAQEFANEKLKTVKNQSQGYMQRKKAESTASAGPSTKKVD